MSCQMEKRPEEALLKGVAGREIVWQKILGQVLGVGLNHSLGPDLNLAKEIRLPVGWSRCVGPFCTLGTPPSLIPHRGREMSFSNIYWKSCCFSSGEGSRQKGGRAGRVWSRLASALWQPDMVDTSLQCSGLRVEWVLFAVSLLC